MAQENQQIKEWQTYQRKPESKIMDDIIRDTILVTKIKIDTNEFKETEEGLIQDGNLEKEQIAAEYEVIIKKQLQMLQADERGRQALQNEIAEIRRKQEKRAETLRTRAKALKIEKERAKSIANRPPPLPRSVKLLLKEQAKKDSEMVSEELTSNKSPLEEILEEDIENSEDKENIDEEYLSEKRNFEEERNKKAKKRFNEALKKDRKKQEHDAILKEIENAEKLNRRQMARNISEPMGKVPCYLPDKLHHAEKQVAMEDAVEDIFKRNNSKEHAIEDLEGYQDKWETKYNQIDSAMESRMIDCVPSFLKDNYSYLLKEETTIPCGKHFSGFDESMDDLNTAYIESPPADILNNSKEIDAVISQLDQMRIELNEAYEKEFKPLLEAEAAPKVVAFDKSVEADLLKLPTEDKSVEVESISSRKKTPLFSKSTQADLLQGGVMSYQRRDLGNMYRSHVNNSGRYLPESFTYQSYTTTDIRSPTSALESWSSSSYLSLPSKHGLPKVCKFCDSPGCAIPLVEDKKFHKDCVPLAKSLSKQSDDLIAKSLPVTNVSADKLVEERNSSSDELHSDLIKSKLASYIRLVADKYLKKTEGDAIKVPRVADHTSTLSDLTDLAAFSKPKPSECVDIFDRRIADIDPGLTTSVSSKHFFRKQSEIEDISAHSHDKIIQHEYDEFGLNLQKSLECATSNNVSSSNEKESIQNCSEVISTNVSFLDNRFEILPRNVSCSPDLSDVATEEPFKKESLTGYVYHDLSTIPEMDSALTNETKGSSVNEIQESFGGKSLSKHADLEDILSEEIDTTSASLVDVPISEVSEIAKGIRFIQKPTPELIKAHDAKEEYASLISGTLSGLSDISSTVGAKTSHCGSDLHTPSSVSTLISESVTKSQAFPYSSSLRDSKTTQSPLTSTSALSKYFQDISSIRHDSEPSSKSSAEIATSVQRDIRRQTELHESSSGAFLPMTPQSYFSTPGEISEKQKNYEAMTSQKNKNVLEYFKTPESNADSFKPMTPHSFFSSVSETTPKYLPLDAKHFSPEKDTRSKSQIGASSQININNSSFKPLSLLSNASIPKNYFMRQTDNFSKEKEVHILDKINEEYQGDYSTSSYFQTMTPHSYFSNPSNIDASSGNRLNEFSTGEELKKGSANLRVKILNPFKNKAASQMYEEQKTSSSPKNFIYPMQVVLSVKDFENSSKDIENNIVNDSNAQQDSSRDNLLKSDLTAKQIKFSKSPLKTFANSGNADVQSTTTVIKAIKVPSAGFNPQLHPEDFTAFEKDEMRENKNDLAAAPISVSAKSVKNKVDSSIKSPDRFMHTTNNNVAYLNLNNSQKCSALTIGNDFKYSQEKLSISSNSFEKEHECSSGHGEICSLSTSPNPILQALGKQLASSAKLCTPCITPSNGSSSENLSEMFAESKITYQSTPVKSIEEIIQETGILEEPSLTLMNTEITIKPDSPEKPRLHAEFCSLLSEDFKTPSSLQTVSLTPNTEDTPSETASSSNYCDSPSLLSFLKHEQSCLNSDNVEAKKLSAKKTPQNEYKKRTKRLWNNLEEVRTKKLLEEKREKMRQNRLKMKSYSKKITTPKKN